jgi:putative toxin-antitoxin system antitoxin component (TIGR02293 family)
MAMVEYRAVEILGLRPPKRSGVANALRAVVETGLAARVFESLANYAHISRSDLAHAANIPLRTVQRRETSRGGRFERAESDRLARVARLYATAEEVFGARDVAQEWMKTPNRALDGARPLDELETEISAREVEDLLGRIRYGVFG